MESNSTSDPEITRRIAALGPRTGPEVSGASEQIFRTVHEAVPYEAQTVSVDLRYGPHERHRLDVHRSATPGDAMPVVLFIHGGGFVKGDKTIPNSFQYGNVASWAVRRGFVGVNMTYRLAPESKWPSGGDDVALAVKWVAANIAAHGGNPHAIFLCGHSAGAAHASTCVTGAETLSGELPGLAGCILLSGNYDQSIRSAPRAADYYGDDASNAAIQSTIDGLVRTKVPLLVGFAEYDPPEITRHTARLLGAFGEAGAALPRVVQAEGHNHYTICHHLGTTDERLGNELAGFISRHSPTPASVK